MFIQVSRNQRIEIDHRGWLMDAGSYDVFISKEGAGRMVDLLADRFHRVEAIPYVVRGALQGWRVRVEPRMCDVKEAML